jgi:hypothetical protein
MLPVKDQDNIYKLRNEEHLGMMEIVEKTGHAFETVAKYSQKEAGTGIDLGPRKFQILKPFFSKIDNTLRKSPNISIKNILFPDLQKEGYKGKLTTLKDYCRIRKPMLQKDRNPSLIDHIEEQSSTKLTASAKPVKITSVLVLEEKYRVKIEKDMREEHPWIPEKEMLSRIRKLGYDGQVTMMGSYMRTIRPSILKDLANKGKLADKINSILLKEPGVVLIVPRVFTKIVKELVREKLLNPMDIVIPNDQKDSRLSRWLRVGVHTGQMFTFPLKSNKSKKNSKGYIKVKAFKVLEDGMLFESEEQVVTHLEDLKVDKNIDAFTATLPETMTNQEVNMFIKKFARGKV